MMLPPFRPPFNQPPSDNISQRNYPPGPPPNIDPALGQTDPSLKAVSPRPLRSCRYQYVYIWLEDGRNFWTYLTYVGRRSVAGYKWIGYRWVYFGTDTDNISEYTCYY